MSKLTINTNLSSLITQKKLKTSENKLNQAIERLTSGCKVNHASDNAVNYAISNNLTTKISAYQVAEDNVSSALDMVSNASSSLSLIEDSLQRLRILQEQAMNGTLGKESLAAINAECRSIVEDIGLAYETTEYNGISLLQARFTTEENIADEGTTFEQLGIGASSFTVYDSSGAEVQSYYTSENDSIDDFFQVLRSYGFTASMSDGRISLYSADYYYVDGDLANALGISNVAERIVTTTTQSSTNPAYYTMTSAAEESSTFK